MKRIIPIVLIICCLLTGCKSSKDKMVESLEAIRKVNKGKVTFKFEAGTWGKKATWIFEDVSGDINEEIKK